MAFKDTLMEEGKPLLVMEYLPLGTLDDQHRTRCFDSPETARMLYQALQALDYLHSQSPPVAHRDIKPENILVHCRTPLVIKLADFGMAKDDSDLKTVCGSYMYAALEICSSSCYTPKVDVWSLGVVGLEFGYSLPDLDKKKRKGVEWCQKIVKAAEDWEDDVLIEVIRKMLKIDPQERKSATECLQAMRNRGLHMTETVSSVRVATPIYSSNGHNTATEDTSKTTQIATSKHDVRSGVQFFHHGASLLDSAVVNNSRTTHADERNITSSSKRRRPHMTSAAHVIGDVPAKRSRGVSPSGLRKQMLKLEHNEWSRLSTISSVQRALAQSTTPGELIQDSVSDVNTQDRTRALLARNLNNEEKGIKQVCHPQEKCSTRHG